MNNYIYPRFKKNADFRNLDLVKPISLLKISSVRGFWAQKNPATPV